MDRTVLVANTSNMPVAAREASIYTGVTIAEYYRDMGKDVVLVADSTSRWAESLREMSGRLEEMPAEEGYPSYLASRLAEFYERAGRVQALGSPDRNGSVTLIGAVSPSGGDFTEPVTTHTMRFIKTFWALDAKLAYSRHYPSINWMNSYSGYLADVAKWWSKNISEDWLDIRSQAYAILQREDTLKEIVRLLGPEALPDEEKIILEVARMIKIGLLQQNSFDDVDTFCSPEKQFKLMKLLVDFYNKGQQAIKDGASLADIRALPIITLLLKARMDVKDDEMSKLDKLDADMQEQFKSITGVKVTN
jgi:V/A-type H+-transporting ATPase subunit A